MYRSAPTPSAPSSFPSAPQQPQNRYVQVNGQWVLQRDAAAAAAAQAPYGSLPPFAVPSAAALWQQWYL